MDSALARCMHIVFDIGNVLLRFDPEAAMNALALPEDRALFMRHVVSSREWLLLDQGELSNAQAAERMCRAPGMQGKQDRVLRFLEGFPLLMDVLPAAGVIGRLQQAGKKVYALSNFHREAFEKVYVRHSFFAQLNGMVISSHVRLLKPDGKIYRALLDKYRLPAQECLFLDDVEENVLAARAVGMQAVQYGYDTQIFDMMEEKQPVIRLI